MPHYRLGTRKLHVIPSINTINDHACMTARKAYHAALPCRNHFRNTKHDMRVPTLLESKGGTTFIVCLYGLILETIIRESWGYLLYFWAHEA